MAIDVYVFLVKTDGGFILVDAGGPTDEAAELLLKNLDEVMGDGNLKLIILTHGHPDHAGMRSSVAQAYPDAQIVFHEHEAPFILGVWPSLNILLSPALFWSSRGLGSSPIGSGLSGLSFAGTLCISSSGIPKLHLILPSHIRARLLQKIASIYRCICCLNHTFEESCRADFLWGPPCRLAGLQALLMADATQQLLQCCAGQQSFITSRHASSHVDCFYLAGQSHALKRDTIM